MAALMEEDVTTTCGPTRQARPRPGGAVQHGHEHGSVPLGGHRVPGGARPRMRAVDGFGELAAPSYELFFRPRSLVGWPWTVCSPVCLPGATG